MDLCKKKFHTYTSPNGFTVIAGRNQKANDELTFDIASPGDLWFHISHEPGPHVVILASKDNYSIPKEDIYFASSIALRGNKGNVDYCDVRYVRRTKTPGLVTLVQNHIRNKRI